MKFNYTPLPPHTQKNENKNQVKINHNFLPQFFSRQVPALLVRLRFKKSIYKKKVLSSFSVSDLVGLLATEEFKLNFKVTK